MAIDARLEGLFDYAGLFPPAELAWEDMLREAARFPDRLRRPHMVAADLVILPHQLDQVTPEALVAAGFDPGRHVRLCLVGVDAMHGPAQAERLAAFNGAQAETRPRIEAVALELHTTDPADALEAVRASAGGWQLYLEPKWDDAQWAGRGDEAWQALDALSQGGRVGLKIRCAGPTALSMATIATILPELVRRRIPFKATQGLHHPFAGDARHGNTHGFLNMVTALRMAGHLEVADLEAVLGDDDPSDFHFEDGLAWRDHRLLEQRVREAEMAVPFSIGSCSLAEPDDDLHALYG